MNTNERKVERMNPKTTEWILIDWKELKTADLFRVFEPDGTPVVGSDGRDMFLAESDPHYNNESIGQINIE
jgi:hypothetical protein